MHYSHQTDGATTTTRGRDPEQELIDLFGSASLHQLNSDLEEMLTISAREHARWRTRWQLW